MSEPYRPKFMGGVEIIGDCRITDTHMMVTGDWEITGGHTCGGTCDAARKAAAEVHAE